MIDLTEVPYESNSFVVLDFETTNTNKGSALSPDNRVVLAVWNSPQGHCRKTNVQWGNEYDLASLVSDIEQADFLVCHNAKFELQWLARAGLDLSKVRVFDTLIAEYVLNGGITVPLGLGSVASNYGLSTKEPYVDRCIRGGVCPSEIPRSLLERRCIYDVNVTHEVFLKQRQKLIETGQLNVLWTRCILTPVLADIEKNGMALSAERVNAVYEETLLEYNEVHRQLIDYTGGINLNSPKQRAEFIYETLGISELSVRGKPLRTGSDGRKTDQDTILKLRGKNKKQKDFLTLYAKYANLNAKLTKSLNTYKNCVDNGDLLLAQFNQTRTKTQRLSSSGLEYSIQFQNQPREFKPLFCARNPDWNVAEIDGAQLEFRVAAFLGQDSRAMTDIINGFDVHSYTAQVMTEAGQDTSRQDAKAHTFKPLNIAA